MFAYMCKVELGDTCHNKMQRHLRKMHDTRTNNRLCIFFLIAVYQTTVTPNHEYFASHEDIEEVRTLGLWRLLSAYNRIVGISTYKTFF